MNNKWRDESSTLIKGRLEFFQTQNCSQTASAAITLHLHHCHGQIQMAVNTLTECDATM
jgi:hypothetical protein